MTSDALQIEPHVLQFINDLEESSGQLASRPIIPVSTRSAPKLRRITRKLSEPAHKTARPVRPILKYAESLPEYSSSSAGSHRRRPSHSRLRPAYSGVPLSFASKKRVPLSVRPSSTRSNNEPTPSHLFEAADLFWAPGSKRKASGGDSSAKKIALEKGHSKEVGNAVTDVADNFYTDPPTPVPTPKLRSTFSQEVPFQGYPLTPRNTFRVKRRTPPAVDELDRAQNTVRFPSRRSFTFSPPATPTAVEFPAPPAPTAGKVAFKEVVARKPVPESTTPRRVSWRPSLPSFTRKSHDRPVSILRPAAASRQSSKRKIAKDAEPSGTKRRKVQFVLPEEHKERPSPIIRRLTPYYEPLSCKIKRLFQSISAKFRKEDEEEKEQKRVSKLVKKREKMARKEAEELRESFRNFDDTVD